MQSTTCIIVWCDSPLGLISTRVEEDGLPVLFDVTELPLSIPVISYSTALFDILRERDGRKVAIHYDKIHDFLGWDFF